MHKRQSGDRGRDSELRRKQKLGEFELVSFSKENARDASAQVTKDAEILNSVLRFSHIRFLSLLLSQNGCVKNSI